jgi:DNA-binding MarR family transcriptional regulator
MAKKTTGAAPPRGARVDRGVLTGLIGFHLRLAQIAVSRDFATTLDTLDVTPGIFAVLVLIDTNAGLKQTELANAVGLDRSSMVAVIDNLERRGLVRRLAVATDRRANALRLTAAGKDLLKKAKRLVAAHEARLAENLAAGERVALVAMLDRIFPEQR